MARAEDVLGLARNLAQNGTPDACTIVGANGALKTGDVITGDDQRGVVVQNGVVRVTFPTLSGHLGAHSLDRYDGSDWVSVLGVTYGDRLLWINEFETDPDRTVVIRATDDVVEWAVIWDAHTINRQDYWHDGSVVYPQSSASPKTITTARLIKVMCVKRGGEGYFLGVRTYPRTDPQNFPDGNNDLAAYNDRSFGAEGHPGLGSRVAFSSNNVTARHPNTTSDGNGAYHQWLGIDDPSGYSGQHANYPAEQTTGPWWVADIPPAGTDLCRYIAFEHRLEVGSLQYAAGQNGSLVVVGINDEEEFAVDGRPKRYQVFLGAFPHEVTDISAEPTASLRNTVARKATAIDWSGF